MAPRHAFRYSVLLAVGLIGPMAAAGCKSSSPGATATETTNPVGGSLPAAQLLQHGQEFVAAQYSLTIDPASMQADVTPLQLRQAEAQGRIFDIDIANFSNDETFTIEALSQDADSNVVVEFRHAHPFAAPNFALPASGSNRADLGYTGRLVVLADQVHAAYFGSSVTLDPSTVFEPSGFVSCDDLIVGAPGYVNDTFPYVLLADEAKDNREGVSNGGNYEGNYNAGGGGWDRSNIGGGNNGWTGYDYVHAGQAIRNTFTLSQTAFAGGQITIEVAVVVKYTEPRNGATQGERLANRFPPPVTDTSKFAYRLPHSALDASRMEITPGAEVVTLAGNCGQLDFRLREWDSLGVEGLDTDLSDETLLKTVTPGARERPAVELDAPFLGTTLHAAILTAYDQGLPGAEMGLQVRIENEFGTATPGTYYACLRAIDPEAATDASYHFGLNPLTLAPDRNPIRATYQVSPVDVIPVPPNTPGQPPIIISSPCDSGGQPLSAAVWSILATNSPTGIQWDFGGGGVPNNPSGNNTVVQYSGTSGVYTGWVSASNAFGTSARRYFSFEIDGPNLDNPQPHVTVAGPVGTVASGNGTLVLTVSDYTDPLPGTVTLQFDWNDDGDFADLGEAMQPLSGIAPVPFVAPITYNNNTLVPEERRVPVQYLYSTVGSIRNALATFVLGPNQPPVAIGTPSLSPASIPVNGTFTMSAGTASATDPEGNPITYKVYDNISPTTVKGSGAAFPIVGLGPYSSAPNNQVTFRTYATDALHPDYLSGDAFFPDQVGPIEQGWVITFAGTTVGGNDTAFAVVSNPVSDMVVTGNFDGGPMDLGLGGLCNQSGGWPVGAFAARYNNAGTIQWSRDNNLNGNCLTFPPVSIGDQRIEGIAFGLTGDVFLTNGGGAAFENSWVARRDGTTGATSYLTPLIGNSYIRAIAVDPAGNAVVGYSPRSTIDFGGGVRSFSGVSDIAVVKYASAAGAYVDDYWPLTNAGAEEIRNVHVDSTGAVYVVGTYTASVNFGGGVRPFVGASTNGFLVKLDSNLNWVWDKTYQSAGADGMTDVITDSTGNVFVCGYFGGSLDFGGGLRPAGQETPVVLRYSSAGTYVWDRSFSASALSTAEELALDSNNVLVVGGRFTGTLNLGGGGRSSNGLTDCFLGQITTNNVYVRDLTFGGTGNDAIYGVAVAGDDTIRAVGSFSTTTDFQPGTFVSNRTSAGGTDGFFLKLENDLTW